MKPVSAYTTNAIGSVHCLQIFTVVHTKRRLSMGYYGVIMDNFWVVRVVTVTVPFLTTLRGYSGNKFFVVNADSFDNFLVDNHKAVLVTMVLTTR